MLQQWIRFASAAFAMTLPHGVQAFDGSIAFVGAITAPTCRPVVSGVSASPTADTESDQLRTAFVLSRAKGSSITLSIIDCNGANAASTSGAVTLVSIYFEPVDSRGTESAGIISMVYE